MPHMTEAEAEARLKALEAGFDAVRGDLATVAARGRALMRSGKERRDEGLLAKIRRQLGLD
jgi:hypothetical protein